MRLVASGGPGVAKLERVCVIWPGVLTVCESESNYGSGPRLCVFNVDIYMSVYDKAP